MFFGVKLFDDFDRAIDDEEHVTTVGAFLEDIGAILVVVLEHILFDGLVIFFFEKIEDFELGDQISN
ncbi:MAG: hypothetical protein WD558_02275 [Pseudomonadales bacterium]